MINELPDLVGVADVMKRYGLRDRRAARRLMDQAGAFMVCGRLLLRRQDLLTYEERLRSARQPRNGSPLESRRTPRPAGTFRSNSAPLPPGWWRTGSGDERTAA